MWKRVNAGGQTDAEMTQRWTSVTPDDGLTHAGREGRTGRQGRKMRWGNMYTQTRAHTGIHAYSQNKRRSKSRRPFNLISTENTRRKLLSQQQLETSAGCQCSIPARAADLLLMVRAANAATAHCWMLVWCLKFNFTQREAESTSRND